MSKFGKNKDNLRLYIRVFADSLVIGFSKLRPFLISAYKFRFKEPSLRLVDLRITIVLVINCNVTLNIKLCKFFTSFQLETLGAYEIVNLNLQA